VTAAELRAMRERQGWSQESLGELLKASLGKGSSTTVGKWEKGIRPVPEDVASFLGKLELDAAYPPPPDELGRTLEGQYEEPLDSGSSSSRGGPGDTAPPPPPPASAAGEERPVGQSPLPGGNTYSRVCEELIAADRAALGKAYGKLAETNDTFRRMLVGMTSGGAWTEVALVSGITFGKCYRSHQAISERKQIESAAELVAEEEGYRGARDGFQGVTAAAA
jgi:transcriptional regulator with XRE-family HTH domain